MIMAVEAMNSAKNGCHRMISFPSSSFLSFFHLWISSTPDAESSLISIEFVLLSAKTRQIMKFMPNTALSKPPQIAIARIRDLIW